MRFMVFSTFWAFLLCTASAVIFEPLEDTAIEARTGNNCACGQWCCDLPDHHCGYASIAGGWSCFPNSEDTSTVVTYPTTISWSTSYSSGHTTDSWTTFPTTMTRSSAYSSEYTHESSWVSTGTSSGKVMPTTAYTVTTKGVTGESSAWSGSPSITLASAQSTFLAKNTTSTPDTLLPTSLANTTGTLSLTTKPSPTQGSIVATTTNKTSSACTPGLWSWGQIMLAAIVAAALQSLI